MKKLRSIWLFLFFLCAFAGALRAQSLRFEVSSQNYKTVTSYLGAETGEQFTRLQFDVNGQGYHKPNWSLTVRLVSPIEIVSGEPNRSGKVFPADKISLRWTIDNNDPNFNLASIGVNRNYIPLQAANEVTLIDRSTVPLRTFGQSYRQFLLYSSFRVDGGLYLSDYLSPSQWGYMEYRIPVLFTLYDEQRNVLGTTYINYMIQFPPSLTDGEAVDVEPEYSLEVNAEAADATLRFLTNRDYQEGVSLSFDDAVKVNSSTDFEIRLKSLASGFLSTEGTKQLPLSIFTVQLTPGNGANNVFSNPKLTLSDVEESLLHGRPNKKKKAQFFNLEYKAKLSPAQVSSVRPGTYTTSLLYQLTPR